MTEMELDILLGKDSQTNTAKADEAMKIDEVTLWEDEMPVFSHEDETPSTTPVLQYTEALEEVSDINYGNPILMVEGNQKTKTVTPRWLSLYSNALYFLLIISALLGALHFAAAGNVRTMFGIGFSYSDNTMPEFGDKSLLIVSGTEPQDYRQGDTITYITSDGTHRISQISAIITNYEKTGKPGFNLRDKNGISSKVINSDSSTGKVISHLNILGSITGRIGSHIIILILIFAVLIAAGIILGKRVQKQISDQEAAAEPQTAAQQLLPESEIIPEGKNKKKSRRTKIISNFAFYLALIALVVGIFAYGSGGPAKNIFGYSYFNVLTKSMQSEIPQGSFVLVKRTDPNSIHVGNDVTYLKPDGSTITHRVIQVFENYDETDTKGFQTQGIENNIPDQDIVLAANVIGVVQFSIPHIGTAMALIAKNIWLVAAWFVLFFVLWAALKAYVSESKKEKAPKKRDKKQKEEPKHSENSIELVYPKQEKRA